MTDTSATGEPATRSWAVVTGASSGIGRELARQFAEHDFNLLISSEDAELSSIADELAELGVEVRAVPADLRRYEGVETLADAVQAVSPIGALALNAGIGVSGPFATGPDLRSELDVVQLNVTSQVHLARRVLPLMVAQHAGRVLITSSIAATQPGPFEAVYAASKAFLFSFAEALRTELSDSGVTVTALMPGPTDTEFFERADMTDTKLGAGPKDDPADVAKQGFEALMNGKDHIVAGSLKNRMMTAAAKVLPQKVTVPRARDSFWFSD
jgi:short-subunit dehydrogenase